MNTHKPKLSSQNLIQKMSIEKGITFNYISIDEANNYLENINNYLRIASYRKNYNKLTYGNNSGKYENLDFSYLVELSTIDMHLRFLITKMCLDIEHSLKVGLVSRINASSDNGYDFTFNFLSNNDFVIKDLKSKLKSAYVSDLIKKYFTVSGNEITDFSNCPIWVLVELLSFGSFINCYIFYHTEFSKSKKSEYIPKNILNIVKSLRNCCAHNNCLINNLHSKDANPPQIVSRYVSSFDNINTEQMRQKLKCRPILEFISLLYVYNTCVSEKVRQHRLNELKDLFHHRVCEKSDFFKDNNLIKSHYNFIIKIINNL